MNDTPGEQRPCPCGAAFILYNLVIALLFPLVMLYGLLRLAKGTSARVVAIR